MEHQFTLSSFHSPQPSQYKPVAWTWIGNTDVASGINMIAARKRDAILFFIIISFLRIISSLKFKYTYPILF